MMHARLSILLSDERPRETAMDADRFDRLTSRIGTGMTRRRALTLMVGGALAALLSNIGLKEADAFGQGCLNLGRRCTKRQQCCSGVCRGPKDRKTCRAHQSGICRKDQDICTAPLGDQPFCQAVGASTSCNCRRTTGNAPFCGFIHTCEECVRDIECERKGYGAGAACVLITAGSGCNSCAATGGTACSPACPDPA